MTSRSGKGSLDFTASGALRQLALLALPLWLCAACAGDGPTLAERQEFPSGTFLIQGTDVWDAATGEEKLILEGHSSVVNSCAISPDGSWIVSASGTPDDRSDDDGEPSPANTVRIWDAVTGEAKLTLNGRAQILCHRRLGACRR